MTASLLPAAFVTFGPGEFKRARIYALAPARYTTAIPPAVRYGARAARGVSSVLYSGARDETRGFVPRE